MAKFKMQPNPILCNNCGWVLFIDVKESQHDTVRCVNSDCKSYNKLFKLELPLIELEEIHG